MRFLPRALVLAVLTTAPLAAAGPDRPEYRLPAALETGDAPPALAVAAVETLLREPGGESDDAWRVLAGLGRPALPETIRALARADWFARALLMTAIAESGVADALPVLVSGTRDPAWAVREAAAAGLSRIPKPEAADALAALVGDDSWRVRRTASIALRHQVSRGTIPRERAIPLLLGLARDPDRDVRYTALRELGNLAAESAADLFLRGYLEGEERERDVCLDALTRLPTAREDLLAALEKAMTGADDREFLKAAEKVAELAGERVLADPAQIARLLRFLRDSSGSLVPVLEVFRKVGRPAVPILLEDLRDFYRSPGRIPPSRDPAQPVLDLVQSILGRDAGPVLRDILLHWEEALPARRYTVVLARRSHAKALTGTLKELYAKEGFADLRAALLEAIEAGAPEDLPHWIRLAALDGNFQVRRTAQVLLRRHPEIDLTETIVSALSREDRHPGLANDWLGLLAARDRAAVHREATKLLDRADPEFRMRGAAWVRVGADPDVILAQLERVYETEEGRHREKDYDLEEERLRAIRAGVLAVVVQSARYAAGAKALPLLERAARDPDPVVREKALAEIARIDDPRSLSIALRALASGDHPAPLREARRIVVASDDPAARAAVVGALSSEDSLTREGILVALRAVGSAPVPDLVETALLSGRWTPEDRVLATRVLASREDPGRVPLFVRLLRESPEQEVRVEAVSALGGLGDDRAVDPLLALLPAAGRDLSTVDPPDQRLAIFALVALGEIGSTRAVPRLLDFLSAEWPLAVSDRTEDRRHYEAVSHTLTALGRIGDPRGLPALLDRLLAPDLSRWYVLLDDRPVGRSTSLMGTLVGALVRFPDAELRVALARAVEERAGTGALYRIEESFLLHLAGLFEDPRIENIARNHPRRGTAADLRRLVLRVVPRQSPADLAALESLSSRSADLGRFAAAADLRARANRLAHVLDPVEFDETAEVRQARLLFLRGLALMEAGREEEGAELYHRGRSLDPEDPDILNLHAWWLAVTGRDLETALESALEAGHSSGSSPYVLDTIGWVLHRLGRHEEAAWQLREAVRLDREAVARAEENGRRRPDPLLSYHLAAAAAMAGRLDAAADWIADAVGMDDTLTDAARADPDFAPLRDAGRLEAALSLPD